jgi:hypothetical protein
MLTFQKVEEAKKEKRAMPRGIPDFSHIHMADDVEQSLQTNEALLTYLADTAREARSVSLSTIHFFKDSLGMLQLCRLTHAL